MIISFTNQKGGVGKTTTAINLGSALADKDYSVLLVDFDPQANLTSGVGCTEYKNHIYSVLSGTVDIKDAIHTTRQQNLFVIPSHKDLSGATIELIGEENREFFLQAVLSPLQEKKDFDFIFIDCPPSLGILTINAFCASDKLIIPLQCEYFAMEGIAQLMENISLIKNSYNSDLQIHGIVLTMYDSRTNLSQEVANEIVDAFQDLVFDTIIPRNVKISEAPSHGLPVILYDDHCLGTRSYIKLAEEYITRWQKN